MNRKVISVSKKKKAGRKSLYYEHVEPNLDLIERLVSEGYTEISIAKYLGVGETVFVKYKKEHPELAAAIKRGRASIESLAKSALIKKALGFYDETGRYHEPDYKSIIMLLRNYRTDDWTEMDQDEKQFRQRELKMKEDLLKEKIIDYDGGTEDGEL